MYEYNSYFIKYPDGDTQQIDHSLKVGDIVDINGIVFLAKDLKPDKIAYKVTGMVKKINFKEINWYYKLDLMFAEEVVEERDFKKIMEIREKKINAAYDKIVKNFGKTDKGRKWHSK